MNRIPLEVECIWYESRPRIDFKLTNRDRGIVSFRGEDAGELLRNVANGYANLLAHSNQLQRENKALRKTVNVLSGGTQ